MQDSFFVQLLPGHCLIGRDGTCDTAAADNDDMSWYESYCIAVYCIAVHKDLQTQ
jgi:hypothetical protein